MTLCHTVVIEMYDASGMLGNGVCVCEMGGAGGGKNDRKGH